jgi:hypothetical protein
MEATRFLDLVPLVHSKVRGWAIRGIRSKDMNSVKQLNVRYPILMRFSFPFWEFFCICCYSTVVAILFSGV